jgi:hypothetical protein
MTQIVQDRDEQLKDLQEQLFHHELSAAKAIGRAISCLVGFSAAKVPNENELPAVSKLLTDAGLFDPEYYRERYTDVVEAGLDPVMHYVVHGCTEGRAPFDLEKFAEEPK